MVMMTMEAAVVRLAPVAAVAAAPMTMATRVVTSEQFACFVVLSLAAFALAAQIGFSRRCAVLMQTAGRGLRGPVGRTATLVAAGASCSGTRDDFAPESGAKRARKAPKGRCHSPKFERPSVAKFARMSRRR